jgi:hypothetical protein
VPNSHFWVTGIIVGWLRTGNGEEVLEDDVAVVQTESARSYSYLRWLGATWFQIDPPESEEYGKQAAIGTKIRFQTTREEQVEYTKLARGEE